MAATVTYGYPTLGATTVAPTAAVMATQTTLAATVQFGDTDTTATITHNWALSAQENTSLFPLVSICPTSSPTTAIPITLGVLGTNTVTILKASATGSAGTVNVNLMKPHSILGYIS